MIVFIFLYIVAWVVFLLRYFAFTRRFGLSVAGKASPLA